jgi:hypothetical protein
MIGLTLLPEVPGGHACSLVRCRTGSEMFRHKRALNVGLLGTVAFYVPRG